LKADGIIQLYKKYIAIVMDRLVVRSSLETAAKMHAFKSSLRRSHYNPRWHQKYVVILDFV